MRSMSFQRGVCAAAVAALVMSTTACQTMTMPSYGDSKTAPAVPLTPAEAQMRQDAEHFDKTVIGGAMTGAAIGALAGALAAALTGGNSKQIRNTAIAGGVAGGVLGGVDGCHSSGSDRNELTWACMSRIRSATALFHETRRAREGTSEVHPRVSGRRRRSGGL